MRKWRSVCGSALMQNATIIYLRYVYGRCVHTIYPIYIHIYILYVYICRYTSEVHGTKSPHYIYIFIRRYYSGIIYPVYTFDTVQFACLLVACVWIVNVTGIYNKCLTKQYKYLYFILSFYIDALRWH